MPGTKKALCIGINYAGSEAELRGPVHDVLRWVDVLTQRCGFQRNQVMALIDEYPSGELVEEDDSHYARPTRENILEALEWFVQGVKEGDSLLFVFSGHGVQVPESLASFGASDARLEEAICPVDWDHFDWGLVPHRLITDSELHRYFARLPGGVLLTVVLDACIAGSAMRVPLRINFEFPDREIDNEVLKQSDYEDLDFDCDTWLKSQHVNALPRRLPQEPTKPLWARMANAFTKETAPPLDEGLAVFCITACREAQTALDATLEGTPQGCLTYCLLHAFELLHFGCTYLELCEATGHGSHRSELTQGGHAAHGSVLSALLRQKRWP